MQLTRGNIKESARDLLSSAGTEWFTDAMLNRFADMANVEVYQRIIGACPDFVTTVQSITWPANSASINLSGASYLNAVPLKIKSIESTMSSGEASVSNPTTPWESASYDEVMRARGSGAGQGGCYIYCLDQSTLHIAPMPAITLYPRVRWIAQLAAFAGDSTVVLNGVADQFHSAVTHTLAEMMNMKNGGANRSITQKYVAEMGRIDAEAHRRTAAPRIMHPGRANIWR